MFYGRRQAGYYKSNLRHKLIWFLWLIFVKNLSFQQYRNSFSPIFILRISYVYPTCILRVSYVYPTCILRVWQVKIYKGRDFWGQDGFVIVRSRSCSTFVALTVVRLRLQYASLQYAHGVRWGAQSADVFAGAKGVCQWQGVSRSEVEGGQTGGLGFQFPSDLVF